MENIKEDSKRDSKGDTKGDSKENFKGTSMETPLLLQKVGKEKILFFFYMK